MYTLCILGFTPSFQGCRIFQGLPPGCTGRRGRRDRQWSLLHGCLELVEVAILLPLQKGTEGDPRGPKGMRKCGDLSLFCPRWRLPSRLRMKRNWSGSNMLCIWWLIWDLTYDLHGEWSTFQSFSKNLWRWIAGKKFHQKGHGTVTVVPVTSWVTDKSPSPRPGRHTLRAAGTRWGKATVLWGLWFVPATKSIAMRRSQWSTWSTRVHNLATSLCNPMTLDDPRYIRNVWNHPMLPPKHSRSSWQVAGCRA